jgi:hypothetical protein
VFARPCALAGTASNANTNSDRSSETTLAMTGSVDAARGWAKPLELAPA